MTAVPVPARRFGKPLHLRRITIEAFEREDGLVDIVGTLIDTKPVDMPMAERTAHAGEPIHHFIARMAVDDTFLIVEAELRAVSSPYRVCGQIVDSYRQLAGLRIGPGFTKTTKDLFRGVKGCTHMSELLGPMATTVFQVVWADTRTHGVPGERHTPVNGCHALSVDGEIVKTYFPHLRPRRPSSGSDTP